MDGFGMLLNTFLGGIGLDANIIMDKVTDLVNTAKSIDKRIQRIENALGLESENIFDNGERPEVLEQLDEPKISHSND